MYVVNFLKGEMKRKNLYIKMLAVTLICFLFNISEGNGKSSVQSAPTGPGSYKTQKIHVGLQYTIKYKRPQKGDPVDMAYEFLELNKEKLGIKNPREELTVGRVERDPVGAMVLFNQVYKGVPIAGSDIRAFFTREGDLRDIEGDYHYDINLLTTPSVDSGSAVKVATDDYKSHVAKVIGPEKPFIVSSKFFHSTERERLYLTWAVKLYPKWKVMILKTSPSDSTIGADAPWVTDYYINAVDGSILYKQTHPTEIE